MIIKELLDPGIGQAPAGIRIKTCEARVREIKDAIAKEKK